MNEEMMSNETVNVAEKTIEESLPATTNETEESSSGSSKLPMILLAGVGTLGVLAYKKIKSKKNGKPKKKRKLMWVEVDDESYESEEVVDESEDTEESE